MNKSFIVAVSLAMLTNLSQGQTAFYDAKLLKDSIPNRPALSGKLLLTPRPNQIILFNLILKQYLPNSVVKSATNDSTLFKAIRESFATNPFIEVGPTQEESNLLKSLSSSNRSTGLLSSLGSLNISTLADGLAKFLIERAKEELNVAFFEKLRDVSKNFPEFRVLFPNTQTLINNFASWEYANVINTLRESFDKDLKQLLFNITQLANLTPASCGSNDQKCKNRITNLNTFLGRPGGRIFLSSVLLGNGFISGQKLPDVINDIAGPNYLGAGFSNDFTNSVQLINIVSLSLRNRGYGKNYITETELVDLFGNAVTESLYLGLLYQQIKNKGIHFSVFDNATVNKKPFIDGIINYTKSVISQAKDLAIAFDSLAKAKKSAASDLNPYLAAVFESGSAFLQTARDLQKIDSSIILPDEIQIVINDCQKTLQIAHDIAARNYSAALIGMLTLMADKLPANDFTRQFVKYGSFAANVVQAKNSDEVKVAIKAVALPAGSASIKKNSTFNVSLNAYLGGFYGNEYLRGSPGKKWAPITGVYAPVGIAASWGLEKFGSVSLFGSIIDISAFASYRLKDDTTKALPEVSLKNIFAPGLGIIYGIPKIPLSIGYTWQYGPMLREIKSTGINASDKPNHRWQFFLAVDIPIVNFYTKTK